MKKLMFLNVFFATGIYIKTILMAILFTCFALSGKAGDQDEIKVTASIIGDIEVVGQRDLQFGIIDFDNPTTIVYNDVQDRSGKFNVTIGPGRPHVLFDFQLPDELEHNGDGPALAIGAWTYGYGVANQDPTISGPFPASNEFEINMGSFQRSVDFYIGATVTPNDDNAVGEYEGIIVLTVENN